MYTFETLKETFGSKLDKEFEEILNNFVKDIKENTEEFIEDRINKVTCMQEIRNYLKNNVNNPKKIRALLDMENVLQDIYIEWRNADGALYDAMEFSIEKEVRFLTTNYYHEKEKNRESR